jgi:hypothetical protein
MLGSTIFFIIFIPFLAFVLLGLSVLLGPHSPYEMKNASYECGFSGFLGQNRTEFAISSQQDTGHLSGIKVKGRKNSLNLYNHQQRSYSTVASRRPLTPIAKVFPKKIYKNADTDKAKILIDNKNKAGIYSYLNCGLRI